MTFQFNAVFPLTAPTHKLIISTLDLGGCVCICVCGGVCTRVFICLTLIDNANSIDIMSSALSFRH